MRLRITFSKTGALRYIGHLDLHTLWERAARRAGLPLAYSQGFHPQPKLQLASALPLGFSSRCEVLDMRLTEDIDLQTLPERLRPALPEGIRVLGVEPVDERAAPLQTRLISAEYEVVPVEAFDPEALGRLEELLAAQSLPRERRGKAYDLRPLIEELAILPYPQRAPTRDAGVTRIFMRLAAREGATGRPEEVLDLLGIPIEDALVERTALIFRD
jgi:radical SAM-linked protein